MDDNNELVVLRKQGFYCSQILMLQGMEMMGKSNPDLIRAMHGLAGGLGCERVNCSAISNAAVFLPSTVNGL